MFEQVQAPEKFIEFDLCFLVESLDDLAARVGMTLETWEEDGLGPARGGFVRVQTPLGSAPFTYLVYDYEYAADAGYPGAKVKGNAFDVADHGVIEPIADLLFALGLKPDDVTWRQKVSAVDTAKGFVIAWEDRQGRLVSAKGV